MSDRTETFVIEQSLPSGRLDLLLRDRFPAVSRGALQRLIEQGHIRVNGQTVKPTHSPHAGESVEVCWPDARAAEAQPEDIPLEILFEDASLLVLNKPPGLVVHPAAGHEEHTLVNALLHHCHGSLSGIGGVARPGIVHRLDKETSGCLVVAKNDEAHLALARQFEERAVEKIYDALVLGAVARDAGEIRASIARHPTHRKRMAVRDHQVDSRFAHTSYRVLERLIHATHVEAEIHTGRTHQIRVHFQFIGHPVLGDATYGANANKRFAEVTGYAAPRVLLHARKLAFVHPGSGEKMTFTAPLAGRFSGGGKLLASLNRTKGRVRYSPENLFACRNYLLHSTRMKSMTGYGRGECVQDGLKVTVELSSVNRKQAEVSVALPRELELLEAPLRDVIHRAVARGRVNVRVALHAADGKNSARKHLDVALAKAYTAELVKLAKQLKLSGEVTLDQVLRAPGVFQTDEQLAESEDFWPAVEKALNHGLAALLKMREREGAHLAKDLALRITVMRKAVAQIQQQAPTTAENYRRNLIERIKAAGLENIAPDDERLLKEVVLFADRSDITEELTRLQSHFTQFADCCKSKEPVGRTLDFLAQEMNREINTIGSKANDAVISREVVTLKAELERFREQAQNVE